MCVLLKIPLEDTTDVTTEGAEDRVEPHTPLSPELAFKRNKLSPVMRWRLCHLFLFPITTGIQGQREGICVYV